jgi:hypothetical protein
MKTLPLLGFLMLSALATAPQASDKDISVKATLGEDVITSLMRSRFTKPFSVSLSGGRSLTLAVDDVYLDFEPNSAIFHVSGKVTYVESGVTFQKALNWTGDVKGKFQLRPYEYILTLVDLWGTNPPDLPNWVLQQIEWEAGELFTIQEAKLWNERGIQVFPEYPIYSKLVYLLNITFADDYAVVTLTNTVRFDAPSIFIRPSESPILANKAWSMYSLANFKNKVREVKIYDVAGNVVTTQAGTGEWAVYDNFSPERPWRRIEPLTPHKLGIDIYVMYGVVENSKTFYLDTERFASIH